MGITGLWQVLDSVPETVSLHQLAIQQGFIENKGGRRGIQIGIDASGWIFRASYRHGVSRNPELATLYARCARLLTAPIYPIFVFDGPNRPRIKRHKKIRGNAGWLVADMRTMLDCFGFPWLEAPGEAEAQLAWMSSRGIIDAVMTDDSDAIVFGATAILRIISEDNEPYTARLYTAEAIRSLGLGPAELLLIAVLDGGDYSDGLQGCGIVSAVALAKAGLGEGLSRALDAESPELFQQWLVAIAAELRENHSGYLARCQPKLADRALKPFLHFETAQLFHRPLINSDVNPAQLTPSGVNPITLAAFCQLHFSWGSGLLRKFATDIFPALAMQELIHHAVALDNGSARHPITSSLIGEPLFRRQNPLAYIITELRVTLVATPELISNIGQAAAGATTPWGVAPTPVERMRAWLPLVMFKHVFPSSIIPTEIHPSSRVPGTPGTSSGSRVAGASSEESNNNQDVIEISSSPEPPQTIKINKKYRMTTTRTLSGRDIIELDTDSDGSI